MAENRLTTSLRAAIQQWPLQEKVLVVADPVGGRAFIQHLVLTGSPCVNLRVATPLELARGVAAPDAKLASGTALTLLLEDLLAQKDASLDAYIGDGPRTPGLAAAFERTIHDLRMADLAVATIDDTAVETAEKGAALRSLLTAYEQALDSHGWIDAARIYRLAINSLQAQPPTDGPLYLVPDPVAWRPGLESRFLELLTTGRRHALEREDAGIGAADVALFAATGPYNEVRAVARRLMDGRLPFDSVEIALTDWATYALAIRDLFLALAIPVTFAGGLPVVQSAAGRALVALLEWIKNGFHAAEMAQAIAQSLIVVPGSETGQENGLATTLRVSPVGWGRDRYLPTFGTLEANLNGRLSEYRDSAEAEDPRRAARRQSIQRELEQIRLLKAWFGDLLALIPNGDAVSLNDLCRAAAAVLARYHHQSDEAAELIRWVKGVGRESIGSFTLPEAARRLLGLVGQQSTGASGPQPGSVHVTTIAGAGWSGRCALCILGMDQERFPGAGLQDPILLDAERQALSPALALSADRLAAKRRELDRLLAGTRGSLSVSFSSFDPSAQREGFPSPVLLDLQRYRSGDPTIDYTTLLTVLGDPEGYLPATGGGALDRQDWWLRQLIHADGQVGDGTASVLDAHPHLARGLAAEAARFSPELTHHDGWVGAEPGLDPRQNPNTILSPSQLESLADCHRRYFFRYVLRLQPPEEPLFDPARWLDPLQRGTLLHEIFEQFLRQIRDSGQGRPTPGDEAQLLAMADQLIHACRDEVPVPSEQVYEQERADLLVSVRLFLRMETGPDAAGAPILFEVGFGAGDAEHPDPVVLTLPSGQQIRIRGRIDRVDDLGEHRYAIWDYKTGSSAKYRDEGYFDGGTQIQHALYALALEQVLRTSGHDPEAQVVQAGYLFPTVKGEGRRVARPQNRRAELLTVLGDLTDLSAQGLFVANANERACEWCDYARACGAKRALDACKPKIKEHPKLALVRRLAEYE